MKYQYVFEWLDQLISVTLHPENKTNAGLKEDAIMSLKRKVEEEMVNIQSTLKKEIFCIKNERALELRVEQYQTTLIRLLDQVYQQEKNCPILLVGLYNTLKETLEHLLHFIEHHFHRYFNQSQRVPLTYWQISKNHLLQQSKKIDALYNSGTSDVQTVPIVMRALQPLLNSKDAITYRQKAYLETLFTQVLTLEVNSSSDKLFTPLQELLIYLNFNHAEIISSLVKQLEDRTSAFPTHEEKTASLHYCMKYIRQLPLKPGFSLFPDLPPVQTFLLEWIEFELDYLQSQSQLTTMHIPTPTDEKDSKIQLSVSVAMLGLFLRLLTEEGIITNKNQSELVRFFATHCTTTRQSEISSDSLYGSYFKPQPGTVRMMKECLLRMQGLLHKKF